MSRPLPRPTSDRTEADEAGEAGGRVRRGRLVLAAVSILVVEAVVRTTTSRDAAWLALLAAMLGVVGGGLDILRRAARQVRRGRVGADVVVAVTSLAALAYSTRQLLVPSVHALHDGWGHARIDVAPILVAVGLAGRWVTARTERARPARRRAVGLAVGLAVGVAPLVVLLVLGFGGSLLPTRHPDLSRRLPAGAGLTFSVDILSARAGDNTIHVYLLDGNGLVGITDLRVTGHLVQFSHLPPVAADVRIGMSGLGHFTGDIGVTAGYWLIELDGRAVDGRVVHAAFNAEIP